MKAGKIWGQTELIHANGVLEFHRIEYKAGYKCSEHEHEFKWNGFFVESGKMLIRVWQNDYDLVDETILLPGDFTQVKPGCVHQFEGIEDGVAFELYWAEFNHNDIKRRTVGGGLKKKPVETDPMRRIIEEENDVFGGDSIFNKNYSRVKDLEAKELVRQQTLREHDQGL